MSRAVYITYEEAKKLGPIFRRLKEEAPWKEARESAGRILEELGRVRGDVEYEPSGGKQIFLGKGIDYDFLMDVINQMELR